jgi:hypothetical protein
MDIAAVSAFLKDRFDLSPAEAHLVARLMTGKSLRSCAKALGIMRQHAPVLSRFSRKPIRADRQN